MMTSATEDQLLRRYLLDYFSEPATEESVTLKEKIEQDYFDNPSVVGRMLVENDLIEEYIDRQLSEDERNRFERFFLSTPQRLDKLRFLEALKELAKRPSVGGRVGNWFAQNWRPLAMVAQVVLIVALGALWVRDEPEPTASGVDRYFDAKAE